MTAPAIGPSLFYGENRAELKYNFSEPIPATETALPPYLSDPLTGPSKIWKIFRVQKEALDFISSSKLEGELLPFAFESINAGRMFLVANPDIFWYRDCQKQQSLRNTYEIIGEHSTSKLYFDLEFSKSANKHSDGHEMTRDFVRIVLYYIRKLFHVKYKMDQVLILDSSNAEKFSCHLIFQTPLVFRNNIHAGHFVKYICNELCNINAMCSDEEQLKFALFKETTINLYSVKDLFVQNATKDKVSLFVDLGVYTRNRHFRLYKSTKKGKSSYLVLSSINKFKLKDIPSLTDGSDRNKKSTHQRSDNASSSISNTNNSLGNTSPEANIDPIQYDRYIFLSSLITYFLTPPDPEWIKEFEKPAVNPAYCNEVNLRKLQKLHSGEMSPTKISPHVEVDNFILTRIKPNGRIFRNVHFPSTNITVYDIHGFRYCGNIGRWHKSQNIKFIADINRGVFYQKCHDHECANYKSPEWPLPPEVLFKIKNDEDSFFASSIDLDQIVKGGEAKIKVENEQEITNENTLARMTDNGQEELENQRTSDTNAPLTLGSKIAELEKLNTKNCSTNDESNSNRNQENVRGNMKLSASTGNDNTAIKRKLGHLDSIDMFDPLNINVKKACSSQSKVNMVQPNTITNKLYTPETMFTTVADIHNEPDS